MRLFVAPAMRQLMLCGETRVPYFTGLSVPSLLSSLNTFFNPVKIDFTTIINRPLFDLPFRKKVIS
jgi:hypothetical protein